jgi:hypothetical protein
VWSPGGCPLARQPTQVTPGLWTDTVLSLTGVSVIKWWATLLMITKAEVSIGERS